MKAFATKVMRISLAAIAAVVLPSATFAAVAQLDVPEVAVVDAGQGKVVLSVTAGATGAPNGFTVYWMKQSDFDANGGQWFASADPRQSGAYFWGDPTLNEAALASFDLAAGQTVEVQIGDLFDETGVSTKNTNELGQATGYVFTAYANASGSTARSNNAGAQGTSTRTANCTFTQGYWKTHPEAWPVTSLTLGTVVYTQAQLLDILNQPAKGNGLISLAHQLIAAKLNIANGADNSAIQATIDDADALIDGLVIPPVGAGFLDPSVTSADTETLDDWNNGITGPGHCTPTNTQVSTWGKVKEIYRR